jgi:hypothetical protein
VPEVADQLAVAAWTTLGIPSSGRLGAATVWYRSAPRRPAPSARTTLAAFLRAALVWPRWRGRSPRRVGNGLLDLAALQFTLSAAAIGGGLPARRWARTHRTR